MGLFLEELLSTPDFWTNRQIIHQEEKSEGKVPTRSGNGSG